MEISLLPYPGAPDRGLPLVRSHLLDGFAHGFTTRMGGVSVGPYQSLNLGRAWGDRAEDVTENRRRVQLACGAQRLALVRQVHGRDVVPVTAESSADVLGRIEADGLVTSARGTAIGVFTADCVPILIGDVKTGAVAAVHAGWRGVVAGVALAAVEALARDCGSRRGDLRFALGPAIGPCCFEVGDEVVAAVDGGIPGARAAGAIVAPGQGRVKPHVDLRLVLRAQLEAAGIAAGHIDAATACTKCDPAGRFYSYRRDSTRTGQHLAVIVPRGG